MPYNQPKIEKIAVHALQNILDGIKTVDHKLSDEDKTPFVDGEIRVYNNANITNESFRGCICVQIRGTGKWFS